MTAQQNQIFDKLYDYWEKHPELRLGRIIVDATSSYYEDIHELGIHDVDTIADADLLRGLEKLEEE